MTLKPGDVVKISLGAHIDGFAGILADTIVVPEKKEKMRLLDERRMC